MKIVALALLVVTVAAAPEDDTRVEKIFNECLAEKNIKEEEVEELAKKDDPKLHCLMACIYEKEGMLQNGELNEDAMVKSLLKGPEKIKEETVYEAIHLCKENVNDVTDVCELINSLTLCMRDLLDKEDVHKD